VGVESCVLDAGGQPVLSLVEASVTVVSVDDVTSGACQAVDGSGPGATSKRIVLEASDQRRWTLVLRIPNLPSDFIRPTDAFELELQGQPPVNPFVRPNQVIMLSRSTELLVFAFVNRFPLPGTTPIDVSDDGEVCSSDLGFTCILSRRRLRVVADGIADTLPPGATRRLGTFSVTVGAASRIGGSQCDSPPSTFKVAGFAVPQ
jgi:hypothetical protein